MKRVHIWLALGGVAGLLALWAVYPRIGVWEAPKRPKPLWSAAEAIPPADAFVPSFSASASVPVLTKSEEPPRSSSPPEKHVPLASPPAGHWDHMAYLNGVPSGTGEAGWQEAIRITATYLSVEPASLPAFEEAARQSLLEMEEALAVRERELAILPPPEGYPAPVSDSSRQSEELYAAARSRAIERMERFLGQTPVHQEFRWGFDSWASMVAAKAQVTNR